MTEESFWSHSWLNYGVDTIRQRVVDHIYRTFHTKQKLEEGTDSVAVGSEDQASSSQSIPIIVENPCGQPEHESTHVDNIILRGTGDGQRCMELIKEVIWPEYQQPQSQVFLEISEETKLIERCAEYYFILPLYIFHSL